MPWANPSANRKSAVAYLTKHQMLADSRRRDGEPKHRQRWSSPKRAGYRHHAQATRGSATPEDRPERLGELQDQKSYHAEASQDKYALIQCRLEADSVW